MGSSENCPRDLKRAASGRSGILEEHYGRAVAGWKEQNLFLTLGALECRGLADNVIDFFDQFSLLFGSLVSVFDYIEVQDMD
jgi:hypothetical protein